MSLNIVEKLVENVVVLDLLGKITLGEETGALRGKVRELVETGHTKILLNLADVSYVDSTGLSTLVSLYTTARNQGGTVKLLNLTKRLRDLLQITRLSTVFDIYDDLEMALQSFEPGTAS